MKDKVKCRAEREDSGTSIVIVSGYMECLLNSKARIHQGR
jgi:hypothetical protein